MYTHTHMQSHTAPPCTHTYSHSPTHTHTHKPPRTHTHMNPHHKDFLLSFNQHKPQYGNLKLFIQQSSWVQSPKSDNGRKMRFIKILALYTYKSPVLHTPLWLCITLNCTNVLPTCHVQYSKKSWYFNV